MDVENGDWGCEGQLVDCPATADETVGKTVMFLNPSPGDPCPAEYSGNDTNGHYDYNFTLISTFGKVTLQTSADSLAPDFSGEYCYGTVGAPVNPSSMRKMMMQNSTVQYGQLNNGKVQHVVGWSNWEVLGLLAAIALVAGVFVGVRKYRGAKHQEDLAKKSMGLTLVE